MNDFLLVQLAREHHSKLLRAAEAAAIIRAAEGRPEGSSRSRRRADAIHPRNG